MSIMKLKLVKGSFLLEVPGMTFFSLGLFGFHRLLRDTEDHEFGRLDRCDADQADETPVVDVVLGHGGPIAFHEERFVRSGSHQSAVEPHGPEKRADGRADRAPGHFVIRLEDGPLRATIDRLFDKDKKAPHVDVLPHRIGRHRARAKDANVATVRSEVANHIHALRIENVLLTLTESELERLLVADQIAREYSPDHFVGRRFVHAALDIHARVYSGYVSRGRNQTMAFRSVWSEHAYPRVIERRVGCVAWRPEGGEIRNARVGAGHCETILVGFAELNYFFAQSCDHYFIGRGEERDVAIHHQSGEALAVFRIDRVLIQILRQRGRISGAVLQLHSRKIRVTRSARAIDDRDQVRTGVDYRPRKIRIGRYGREIVVVLKGEVDTRITEHGRIGRIRSE